MTVLSDADRKTECQRFMNNVDERQDAPGWSGMTKAQLRDAVNAIDQWVEDNKASFNSAIPQPARGKLSSKHKSEILFYVIRRRWEVE